MLEQEAAPMVSAEREGARSLLAGIPTAWLDRDRSREKPTGLRGLRLRPELKLDSVNAWGYAVFLEWLQLDQAAVSPHEAKIRADNPASELLVDPPARASHTEALRRLSRCRDRRASRGGTAEAGELNLARLGLYRVPGAVWLMGWLTQLRLGHNRLFWLPKEIGNLSALSQLDLAGNRLHELPGEIGELRGLRSLDLMDNQIGELPAEFGRLRDHLTKLYLSGNPIVEPPPRVWTQGIKHIREYFAAQLSAARQDPLPVSLP